MANRYYQYDLNTLSFVELKPKRPNLYAQLAAVAVGTLVFAALSMLAFDNFLVSPEEIALQKENTSLRSELARYQTATDSLLIELQRVRRDSIPNVIEPHSDDPPVRSSDRLARIESKISTLERFLIALIVTVFGAFLAVIINRPRYVFLPPTTGGQSSSGTSEPLEPITP